MASQHDRYCDGGHSSRQRCNRNLDDHKEGRTDYSSTPATGTDPEPTDADLSRQLVAFIVSELQLGKTPLQVADQLKGFGMDHYTAWDWVHAVEANVVGPGAEAQAQDSRFDHLLIGVLAVGAGLTITGCTYAAAGPGETYYIVWGPVVYGGYRLLLWLTSRH